MLNEIHAQLTLIPRDLLLVLEKVLFVIGVIMGIPEGYTLGSFVSKIGWNVGYIERLSLEDVSGDFVGILVGDSVSHSGAKPKYISISSPNRSSESHTQTYPFVTVPS